MKFSDYLLSLNNIPGKTCNENPPGARLQTRNSLQRPPRATECQQSLSKGCLRVSEMLFISALPSGYPHVLSHVPPWSVTAQLNVLEESSNPNQDQDSCLESTEGRAGGLWASLQCSLVPGRAGQGLCRHWVPWGWDISCFSPGIAMLFLSFHLPTERQKYMVGCQNSELITPS